MTGPSAIRSPHAAGLLFAVLSAFGFALKAIFVKLGLAQGGDAITLLALRMGFSLPMFLVLAWMTGARGLSLRDWLALAVLGLLGFYLSSLFDFLGLQYISVGLERLILFLYPTLVLLFSALFLRHPVDARVLVALALSYAGIALALGHDLRAVGDVGDVVTGSLWVFASATTFAIYFIGAGRVVARVGALRLTAYASTFACLFTIGHFLAVRPLSALVLPPTAYLVVLGLAVFSTLLPIWFQAEAIRRVGATTASLVGTIGPVLTIGLGWLVLDEPVSAVQLAGAALVVAGVVAAGRGGTLPVPSRR
ncbi:MAG: DMT family transporter [Gammaproteobacteria bacterium]|nr:DMT family transporter [Gammaproteobacteria bacterium]